MAIQTVTITEVDLNNVSRFVTFDTLLEEQRPFPTGKLLRIVARAHTNEGSMTATFELEVDLTGSGGWEACAQFVDVPVHPNHYSETGVLGVYDLNGLNSPPNFAHLRYHAKTNLAGQHDVTFTLYFED